MLLAAFTRGKGIFTQILQSYKLINNKMCVAPRFKGGCRQFLFEYYII